MLAEQQDIFAVRISSVQVTPLKFGDSARRSEINGEKEKIIIMIIVVFFAITSIKYTKTVLTEGFEQHVALCAEIFRLMSSPD